MKRACIFCASSTQTEKVYRDAAAHLGEALVNHGWGINYGGGAVGLMGAIADSMLSLGGDVKGIIPRFMVEVEWEHKGVSNMVHVDTMAQRKALLIKDVDAVIAMPGSIGTLEELFEVLSNKKLGLFDKPIILLNTKGFFDPLILMLNRMIDERFMRPQHGELWIAVENPENVIPAIEASKIWNNNPLSIAVL